MFDLNDFQYKKILFDCFDNNSKDFNTLIEIYNNEQTGVIEKHHIIPKSYFKLNKQKIINKNNLINLSAKNHYKAHYYMWKCCKIKELKEKLAIAFLLLNDINEYKENELDIRAEEYENIQKQARSILQKKIICLNTGIIYNSLTEASNYNERKRKQITNVLTKKQSTAYGEYWEYYNESIKYTKEYCKNKMLELDKKKKEKIYNGKHKNDLKYICLDTMVIYNNVGEINRDYPNSGVPTNLKRGRKLICGEHWEVYNENIKYTEEYCKNTILELDKKRNKNFIPVFCLETKKVYISIREAARELKIDPTNISKILNGKLKSTHGYHFTHV